MSPSLYTHLQFDPETIEHPFSQVFLCKNPDANLPQFLERPTLAARVGEIGKELLEKSFQDPNSRGKLLACLLQRQAEGERNPFFNVRMSADFSIRLNLRFLVAFNVRTRPDNPANWEILAQALQNNEFIGVSIEGWPKTMYNQQDCLEVAQKLRGKALQPFEIQSQQLMSVWNRALHRKALSVEWAFLSKSLLNFDIESQQTQTYTNTLSTNSNTTFSALYCAIQAITLNPQNPVCQKELFKCFSTGRNPLIKTANLTNLS